jgi:hypothetical protein
MAEIFTLTTPIPQPSIVTYTVHRVVLDLQASVIQVWLLGSNGVETLCEWDGAVAATFLTQLNSANFTTTSFIKATINACVAAGKIPPGSVSGTPS